MPLPGSARLSGKKKIDGAKKRWNYLITGKRIWLPGGITAPRALSPKSQGGENLPVKKEVVREGLRVLKESSHHGGEPQFQQKERRSG